MLRFLSRSVILASFGRLFVVVGVNGILGALPRWIATFVGCRSARLPESAVGVNSTPTGTGNDIQGIGPKRELSCPNGD